MNNRGLVKRLKQKTRLFWCFVAIELMAKSTPKHPLSFFLHEKHHLLALLLIGRLEYHFFPSDPSSQLCWQCQSHLR